MEDKDVVELKDLKNYVNSKWSIWYSQNEIMYDAPYGAPDWVKAAWVPMPYNKHHSYDTFQPTHHSYDCSPDGVVFEGGPQAGTIKPHYPGKGGDLSSFIAHEGNTPVGIYELKKQTWNYQGYHYHRLVYIFKPASPKLKLKSPVKKLVPEPNKYEMSKHEVWSGYKMSEEEKYPSPSYSHEIESAEYHKKLGKKFYKPNTSYSSGTHTGTISFNVADVSPEMMNVLYGESAKLDPWVEPEPEDVALWDAI